MLTANEWAEIHRLRVDGVPIAVIAGRLHVTRNTVRRALAAPAAPAYRRAPRGSIVDSVEPLIRAELARAADVPVRVIAERIGWTRGRTVLSERVRRLRAAASGG